MAIIPFSAPNTSLTDALDADNLSVLTGDARFTRGKCTRQVEILCLLASLTSLPEFFLQLGSFLSYTRTQILVGRIKHLELSFLAAKLVQPFTSSVGRSMSPSPFQEHRASIDGFFYRERASEKTSENPSTITRKQLLLNLNLKTPRLLLFSLSQALVRSK
jgi:hypothetical protein